MKCFRFFSIVVILASLLSTSCTKASVGTSPTSTAGALTANGAINDPAAHKFGKQNLNSAGPQNLFEYIRPEVRAKLDEEPTGDADSGYDPGTSQPSVSIDESQTDASAENQPEDQSQGTNEDAVHGPERLESKFAWAKKSFGDALKADITSNGVIVLYADDNYYDAGRLMEFVERGRNTIAERADVEGNRIQVVYGGYRSVPQVEYWIVPQGGPVPEFKPEDRNRPADPE
ncbi:MAG TPA: hypothetical protein VJV05_17430 [Pyrinomonadaceae bacterium]|nr:hypothetical protein [Pyrinomonadaceae bacterium]